jgi:hypothetical protein
VAWVSILFSSYSQKFRVLNLLPFAQVLFDWFENFSLAALSKQYLADGTISSSTALIASTSSSIKWVFSLLVYGVILIGIVLRIVGALKKRSQR